MEVQTSSWNIKERWKSPIVWYVFLNANKKWNEENRGSEDGCDQTALQLENDMLSKNPRKLFKWNPVEVKGGITVKGFHPGVMWNCEQI